MEQRLRAIRDIVLTSVVLDNMLRTHQGGADRVPTPKMTERPYKMGNCVGACN